MPVKELPIFTYYDVQRFKQFSPQDCANWYLVTAPTGKRKMAMYPCMGRKHIQNVDGMNVLNFSAQPRRIYRSIDFMYVVVSSTVFKVNSSFTATALVNADFTQDAGFLSFDYLPLVQAAGSTSQTQAVFCGISDGVHFYIINENDNSFTTITDPNTPSNPRVVKAFGNRFAVSSANSTEFRLTQINCYDTVTAGFNAATLFTVPGTGGKAVFAQETGIIKQMVVLHNTLYIFSDYECGIWSNIPSTTASNTSASSASIFPWKKNTSLNWDYGIADPDSIDVDFGRMVWLAQNRNGLVQFMASDGQMPQSISTQAINVLLQQTANAGLAAQFLQNAFGFLYQYEDSIFYRVTSGTPATNGELLYDSAGSIEYNFDTGTWERCIEVDGDRNIIQDHVFFSQKHIVTAIGQNSLYEMAGNIYINEIRNPDQIDPTAPNAFIAYPMRYELVTSIISEEHYEEFKTNWVQIDFVWGEQTFINSDAPFNNTVFIVSEASTDANPIYLVAEDGVTYIIAENGNTPELDESTYNALFKPHIELFVSDDGGITFYSVDNLEFSQLGVYSWRMRWYQCGLSRNRVYNLVCVSPSPIVILGAIHETEIVSGGAY
jgi:hypothetical protein